MKLIRRSLASLSMLVLFAAVGCASKGGWDGGNGTYSLEAIELEGMGPLKDGSLRVLYRPPAETMFSCPGVNVVEDAAGVVKVSFVRAPLRSEAKAQISAVTDPNTGVDLVILPDAVNKQVILVGGEWEREIWRRGGPIR